MKRVITSIVVCGVVIYASVVFEFPFFLIGIPICAIIGGSQYLAAKKISKGSRVKYIEHRADEFSKSIAKQAGLKDGDIITVNFTTSFFVILEKDGTGILPVEKTAFVLVD